MKRHRTKADLLKDPRVVSMWKEDVDEMGDGKHWYWLELAAGYVHELDSTHVLHEPTIKDLSMRMRDVVKESADP
jgi:hypothetical protein